MIRSIAHMSGAMLALVLAGAGPVLAVDQPSRKAPAPVVTVVEARRGPVVETVHVTGTLVPREEILVGPEVEGLRILELLVDEGDKVEKGQTLARLSKDTLLAQIAQSDAQLGRADAAIAQAQSSITLAEASVAQSEPALERARTLKRTGAGTEATLEQRVSEHNANLARLNSARRGLALSQADKKALEAQRQELEIRLARTEVKSPAAGTVSRRSARVGGVASLAADPMFRIIANGEIELEAEVPDFRLRGVRAGQPAVILAGGEKEIAGKVRLVSPEIDRASRLGKVRVSAAQADPALKIGGFARGEIETQRREAVSVPASAVLYDSEGAYAQAVTNAHVATRRLKIGLVAGGVAEVVAGLAEGEIVIQRAGAFLNDGDAVDPRPATQDRRSGSEKVGSR